jgi:hypothetical protein
MIEPMSLVARVLPLPKKSARGSGLGWSAGGVIADVTIGATGGPWWLRPDGATALVFESIKKLQGNAAADDEVVGCWYDAQHRARALCWKRDGDGHAAVDLHPVGWDVSSALGCAGGEQIGYGEQGDTTRALWWRGSAASLVVLAGPDPELATYASAIGDAVQGGRCGREACLWRGSSDAFVSLHPATGFVTSEVLAIGGDVQVGSAGARAALWRGSAASFVDLTPPGSLRAIAQACVGDVQVGWVSAQPKGIQRRAAMWTGTAASVVDLHAALPTPWNASSAYACGVADGRLWIVGTAEQVELGRFETSVTIAPVLWSAPAV